MQNQAPDLSQLKDIHLPSAITEWPIAYGWWLLLLVIIATTAAAIFIWLRQRKNNATKKAALILLSHQYEEYKQSNNGQVFLQQVNTVLKRYCLEKYPEAVSLSGTAWTDFLIRHSQKAFFNEELARAMSQGIYQPHCEYDASALFSACSSWLKNNKAIEARTKVAYLGALHD